MNNIFLKNFCESKLTLTKSVPSHANHIPDLVKQVAGIQALCSTIAQAHKNSPVPRPEQSSWGVFVCCTASYWAPGHQARAHGLLLLGSSLCLACNAEEPRVR